jgi:trehalose synthase-fused probable maltokinase
VAPAVLRVDGSLEDALHPGILAEVDKVALARWLETRRWYGGKGSKPTRLEISWIVPVPESAGAIVGLKVETDAGTSEYQVPLTVERDARSDDALAVIHAGDDHAALVDGFRSAALRSWLLEAIVDGVVIDAGDVVWRGEAAPSAATVRSDAASGTVVTGEQSNTSVLYGKSAILKLFRRLEPGMHPDIEISRVLAGRSTPEFLGACWIEANGKQLAAGILQRQVPGARDAWSFALENARQGLQKDDAHAFHDEAAKIGGTVRRLHDALATEHSEGFEVRDAGLADVERWSRSASSSADNALAMLSRAIDTNVVAAGQIPSREELSAMSGSVSRILSQLTAAVGDDAGKLLRHHGDLHLGQIIHSSGGDYAIIDFEGEPTRPLEDRRMPNSPLRDVAGMLRSFSYAAATLERGGIDGASSWQWEGAAQSAFMEGYLSGGEPSFLPGSEASMSALLELFVLEKAFYELAYELANRPEWVGIPLKAVREISSGRDRA